MENICQGHVSSELCGPRQRQQRPLPVPVPVAHTVYVLVDLKTKEGSGLVWINMAWSGLVWPGPVWSSLVWFSYCSSKKVGSFCTDLHSIC